jgi:two-component sensor histidine kinase
MNGLVYDALCTLGNAYSEKGQLPAAKKLFDEALEISRSDTSIDRRSHILLNLGIYYYKNLEPRKAVAILNDGAFIARKENNMTGLMDIYSAMGDTYIFLNKTDSAQHFFLTALEYFHQEKKPRREASINVGLANAFGRLHNFSKMEEYFTKAYILFRSIGDHLSAINSLIQKSAAYLGALQLEKSATVLNEVEFESRKYNVKPQLAFIYLYKAIVANLVGDTVSARKYQVLGEEAAGNMNMPAIEKAKMLLNALTLKTKLTGKPADSVSRKVMALLQREYPKELIDQSVQSISLNKKLLAANPSDFKELYQMVYPEKKDAMTKFVDSVFRQPFDSALTITANRQLLELETRYQTKQKADSLKIQDQQIQLGRQQAKRRELVLMAVAVLALSFLAFGFYIYRTYKKEKEDKARISLLRKELQHKVKNDLAILIRMAEVTSKKEEGNLSIKELESRIKSIASVHEQLYASDDMSEINFKTFTERLGEQIRNSFGTEASFQNNIDAEFRLSTSNSTPLALILNELMTNSFKYAFRQSQNNQISITMKPEKDGIRFFYHDNGPGVTNEKKGFGFKLIQGLSSQVNGIQRMWNDAGFNFELIIPS